MEDKKNIFIVYRRINEMPFTMRMPVYASARNKRIYNIDNEVIGNIVFPSHFDDIEDEDTKKLGEYLSNKIMDKGIYIRIEKINYNIQNSFILWAYSDLEQDKVNEIIKNALNDEEVYKWKVI